MKTEQQILNETRDFVNQLMVNNDVAHDHLHVERVVNLSKRISQNYSSCDQFLVEMIALLHDINDNKLSSCDCDFNSVLQEIIGDKNRTTEIISFIDYISFRKYPSVIPSLPIEVQIVQDADRLDAIGAVGVARTFAYSGAKGIPFYADPPTKQSTLTHFREKLLKLHTILNTDEAKMIAIRRQQILELFYNEFINEID